MRRINKKHTTLQDVKGAAVLSCGPFFALGAGTQQGVVCDHSRKYLKVFIDKLLFTRILTHFDIAR